MADKESIRGGLAALVAVISVLYIFVILIFNIRYTFIEWVEIYSLVSFLVLAGLLVALYWQMLNVQKEQNRIKKGLGRLMYKQSETHSDFVKAEYEPVVEIIDWGIKAVRADGGGEEKNSSENESEQENTPVDSDGSEEFKNSDIESDIDHDEELDVGVDVNDSSDKEQSEDSNEDNTENSDGKSTDSEFDTKNADSDSELDTQDTNLDPESDTQYTDEDLPEQNESGEFSKEAKSLESTEFGEEKNRGEPGKDASEKDIKSGIGVSETPTPDTSDKRLSNSSDYTFLVTLSNPGKGIARNLSIKYEIKSVDTTDTDEDVSVNETSERVSNESSKEIVPSKENLSTVEGKRWSGEGGVLRPGEAEKGFSAPVSFTLKKGIIEEEIDLGSASEILVEKEVEEARLSFTLVFEDLTEKEHEKLVYETNLNERKLKRLENNPRALEIALEERI